MATDPPTPDRLTLAITQFLQAMGYLERLVGYIETSDYDEYADLKIAAETYTRQRAAATAEAAKPVHLTIIAKVCDTGPDTGLLHYIVAAVQGTSVQPMAEFGPFANDDELRAHALKKLERLETQFRDRGIEIRDKDDPEYTEIEQQAQVRLHQLLSPGTFHHLN